MHSTEIPITEWWDPPWDTYDVPLSPNLDDPDAPDHDTWWAAYEHLWMLRHIMTGQAEYVPSHFQHQLTTGAENWCFECEDVHPPGHHTDPEPCLCTYVRHSARLVWGTLGKRVLAHDVVIATGFQIKPWCVHHGESRRDRWVDVPTGLPWETTLGPDETENHR